MRIFRKKLGIALLALCITAGLGTMSAQAAQEKAPAKVKSVSIKTNTGGDFVKGVSKANVTFQISGSKSDVVVSILSESGATVYKKTFSNCSTNKKYTLAWNGKRSNGKYIAGTYRAKVTAGKSSKKTGSIKLITKSDFAGGDGSKSHPYKVSNVAQFKNIAKHNGKYFAQTKNISYNYGACTPLFTNDDPFTGTYDGKNYTISNINLNVDADYVGLFRAIGEKGNVKNLKLRDCIISGKGYVGVIAGMNSGQIINCSAVGCNVSGENFSAVMAGNNEKGTINNCKTQNCNIISSYDGAGSMAGRSTGTIKNCNSAGDGITANHANAGGIAGELIEGSITDCNVNEDMIVAGGNSGGVAGYSLGIITGCVVYDEKGQISCSGDSWWCKCGGIIGHMGGGLQRNNTYYGLLSAVGRT